MFGSNFKPDKQGTPETQTEDSTGLKACDSWTRKAANDQLNEYVMQPICSVEQPESNSEAMNNTNIVAKHQNS